MSSNDTDDVETELMLERMLDDICRVSEVMRLRDAIVADRVVEQAGDQLEVYVRVAAGSVCGTDELVGGASFDEARAQMAWMCVQYLTMPFCAEGEENVRYDENDRVFITVEGFGEKECTPEQVQHWEWLFQLVRPAGCLAGEFLEACPLDLRQEAIARFLKENS